MRGQESGELPVLLLLLLPSLYCVCASFVSSISSPSVSNSIIPTPSRLTSLTSSNFPSNAVQNQRKNVSTRFFCHLISCERVLLLILEKRLFYSFPFTCFVDVYILVTVNQTSCLSILLLSSNKTECDRVFVSNSDGPKNGSFTSPVIENKEHHSRQCIYTFIASENERVQVTFSSFNLKGVHPEYVTIHSTSFILSFLLSLSLFLWCNHFLLSCVSRVNCSYVCCLHTHVLSLFLLPLWNDWEGIQPKGVYVQMCSFFISSSSVSGGDRIALFFFFPERSLFCWDLMYCLLFMTHDSLLPVQWKDWTRDVCCVWQDRLKCQLVSFIIGPSSLLSISGLLLESLLYSLFDSCVRERD